MICDVLLPFATPLVAPFSSSSSYIVVARSADTVDKAAVADVELTDSGVVVVHSKQQLYGSGIIRMNLGRRKRPQQQISIVACCVAGLVIIVNYVCTTWDMRVMTCTMYRIQYNTAQK